MSSGKGGEVPARPETPDRPSVTVQGRGGLTIRWADEEITRCDKAWIGDVLAMHASDRSLILNGYIVPPIDAVIIGAVSCSDTLRATIAGHRYDADAIRIVVAHVITAAIEHVLDEFRDQHHVAAPAGPADG